MPKILILESQTPDLVEATHESGGLVGSDMFIHTLKSFDPKLEFVVKMPYAGDFDAQILHDVDGVILTGSSVEWSVDDPRAKPLQNAAHAAFNSTLPIWGSCNGLQMAAFLLQGQNGASPNGMEVGLARDLRLSEAGRTHPMMKGRVDGFMVPCVHRDEVIAAPENGVVLASNTHSAVQALAIEVSGVKFWGTQYHPEMRAADVANVLQNNQGIFSDRNNEAKDLSIAESDENAAAKLGTTTDAMKSDTRALELKNWVEHFLGT